VIVLELRTVGAVPVPDDAELLDGCTCEVLFPNGGVGAVLYELTELEITVKVPPVELAGKRDE
jgi:hypothetical protein